MNIAPDKKRNSRLLAADIIGRWLETGDFPDRLIPANAQDRAFLIEVVYGVTRRWRTLQWLVGTRTARPPDKPVLPFLYVGLYQILFMNTVADYAAVSETVEAAKVSLQHKSVLGFLNAVLRKAVAEKTAILAELAAQKLAIRESHPDVLVERWIARYGEDRARALCEWDNSRPPVMIHPNLTRISLSDFVSSLSDKGVQVIQRSSDAGFCLELPRGARVQDLPGYAEGLFSVQDLSTMEAIHLLDPQPGSRILDLCSAPGGKVILMAERAGGAAGIIALDLHEDRIARLKENLTRMKLEAAKIVKADAGSLDELRKALGEARFDHILLDVPCSNTGVLGRRPDARWRFSTSRLRELTRLQARLLQNAAAFLAEGGTLVYSTCSMEPEEGENIVSEWVARYGEFVVEKSVRLFPPESRTDGVYAALIRKARA